ncbi:MAG TPA: hypothetical protein VKB25_02540, partial [Conexibacter sp.]|nr:hypothetical protein [Conexibacter sp.]
AGLTSLQREHGIERLLDVILFTAGTGTSFDSIGHLLRTNLVLPVQCLPYAVQQISECSATFTDYASPAAATATTTTPPADALDETAATSGDSSASLVDAPEVTGSDQQATGSEPTPTGSGVLSYLLGGSGER